MNPDSNVTCLHLQDDLETLKGRTKRDVRAAIVLLCDGLDALQRPTDKTYVVQDHIERAITLLDGLVNQ